MKLKTLKVKVGTRSRYRAMYRDFYFESLEIYEVQLSILPTKSSSKKLHRAVNRLLPVGHRHRGDVGIA